MRLARSSFVVLSVAAVAASVLTTPPASAATAAAASAASSKPTQPVQVKPVRSGGGPLGDPATRTAPVVPARLPSAGSYTTSGAGAAGQVVRLRSVTGPAAARAATTPAAASVSSVQVDVLGAGDRAKVGTDALAFQVRRVDGVRTAGRADLTLDYSAFRELHGGNWAGRLRVFRYPACVLTTPSVPACSQAAEVKATNDLASGTLQVTADVDAATPPTVSSNASAAASATSRVTPAAAVYALAAAGSSVDGGGTYTATKLNVASTWEVGIGSGNFSTTYPIELPDPPAGPKPTLQLEYNSQSLDGLTLAANQQSSVVGEGWDLSTPYIERQYASCKRLNSSHNWGDLCWPEFYNATLSFPGHSSKLITMNGHGGEWKLQDDSGWKIEEKTGAANGEINGRYFVMTTSEGTQYWFGVGHQRLAGADPGNATDSVLTVPVGAVPGQNGGFAANVGYRWYLDRVVDVHNMQATYYYKQEQNAYYSIARGISHQLYDAAGRLSKVDYGGPDTAPNVSVRFDYELRCTKNVGPDAKDGNYDPDWNTCGSGTSDEPDVPDDQYCAPSASSCTMATQNAPTFFTRYLLRQVGVFVADADTSFKARTLDRFFYTMPDPKGGTGQTLWLARAQHFGAPREWTWPGDTDVPNAAGSRSYSTVDFTSTPPTFFSSVGISANEVGPLKNRYDDASGKPSLNHLRIREIQNPMGGETYVTYSPEYCAYGNGWDKNTSRCFREFFKPKDGAGQWGIFNKYVVTKVVERDKTGGSPDVVTRYMYDGKSKPTDTVAASDPDSADAAWHFQDIPINLAPVDDDGKVTLTYSDWRGYQMVTVWHGLYDDRVSKTQYRLYRGMDGSYDPAVSTCTRDVKVSDGATTWLDDVPYLQGRVISVQTWDTGNHMLSRTVYGYTWTRGPWGAFNSARTWNATEPCGYYGGVSELIVRNKTDVTVSDAGSSHTTETTTADDFGRVVESSRSTTVVAPTTSPLGSRTSTSTTCTTTTYATGNPDQFKPPEILDLPASVVSYEQTGLSSPTCPKPGSGTPNGMRFAQTDTFYDGNGSLQPAGGDITKGEPTRVDTWTSDTAKSTVRTAYDGYGRVTSVTDPRGKVTSTTYYATTNTADTKLAASEYPSRVVVTNPLFKQSTTLIDARLGVPFRVTDANNRQTDLAYDKLGRLVCVFLPAASGSGTAVPVTAPGTCDGADGAASIAYTYAVDQHAAPEVDGRVLQSKSGSSATVNRTWTFYDGFGRLRQEQRPNPSGAGGALATTTDYNDHGLAARVTSPTPITGTGIPGALAAIPTGTASAPVDDTITGYDDFERPITVTQRHNGGVVKGDDGVELKTTTDYSAWGTSVQGPTGGPTVTMIGALGKSERVRVFAAPGSSSFLETLLSWTPGGFLESRTTPKGVTNSYGYDWVGHATSMSDPDAGNATATYDASGNLLVSTDGKGKSVYHQYDDLGRLVGLYSGTDTSGTKLAGFHFDGSGQLGLLSDDTGYDGSKTLTRSYTYDGRSRATGVTITPDASYGFPSGPYMTTTGYDEAGHITSSTLPAAGDLPAETVNYGYTANGDPTTVTGATTYVTATAFTNQGRLGSRTYAPGGTSYTRDYSWKAGTALLERARLYPGAAASSPTGAVQDDTFTHTASGDTIRLSDAVNSTATCYGYDSYRRLTRAWTQSGATSACAAPAASAAGTGTAPMNLTYSYDADASMTSVQDGNAGGSTTTYTYPSASSPHPHLPTSIGSQNVTVDANGQVTGLGTQTYAWDELHRLASTSPSGTTSSAFAADGSRLVRSDPDGSKTLYLPGQELTTRASGSATTRYITQGGATVAVRTGGGYRISGSDTQGTPQIMVDPATGAVTRQWLTPYGSERATSGGNLQGQRRFLDHVQDPTGVLDDGARSYVPVTGLFLSTDPLADIAPTQAANPYAYAAGNPIANSDPTGLYCKTIPNLPQEDCPSSVNHSHKSGGSRVGENGGDGSGDGGGGGGTSWGGTSTVCHSENGCGRNGGYGDLIGPAAAAATLVPVLSAGPSTKSFDDATRGVADYYNGKSGWAYADGTIVLAEVEYSDGTLRTVAFLSSSRIKPDMRRLLSNLGVETWQLADSGLEGHAERAAEAWRQSMGGAVRTVHRVAMNNNICSEDCAGALSRFAGRSFLPKTRPGMSRVGGVLGPIGEAFGLVILLQQWNQYYRITERGYQVNPLTGEVRDPALDMA